MAELRVWKGATEVTDIARIEINKHTERLVDSCKLVVKGSGSLDVGDEITITKADGTTKIFGGYITKREKKVFWELEAMGYGWELNNIWVTKVYENKAPEEIVQDLIDNNTNLTYSSSSSSGVTITKYVVDDYIYKAVDEMCKILDWQFRVDVDKKAYFEPRGSVGSGAHIQTE